MEFRNRILVNFLLSNWWSNPIWLFGDSERFGDFERFCLAVHRAIRSKSLIGGQFTEIRKQKSFDWFKFRGFKFWKVIWRQFGASHQSLWYISRFCYLAKKHFRVLLSGWNFANSFAPSPLPKSTTTNSRIQNIQKNRKKFERKTRKENTKTIDFGQSSRGLKKAPKTHAHRISEQSREWKRPKIPTAL